MAYENPEGYERFMGRWSVRLAPQMIEFCGLQNHMGIADIGCGTGNLAAAIIDRFDACQVHGVDSSPQFIAYANRRHGGVRLAFEVGDAMALAFPGAAFDASISLLLLQGVLDASRAMAEMRRVVKPGGLVAGAVWNFRTAMPLFSLLREAVAGLGGDLAGQRGEPTFAAPGDFAALWHRADLTDVVEAKLDVTCAYCNFDYLWQSYLVGATPTSAAVAAMDASQQQSIAAYLQQAVAAEGGKKPFTLNATAWAVKGLVPGNTS